MPETPSLQIAVPALAQQTDKAETCPLLDLCQAVFERFARLALSLDCPLLARKALLPKLVQELGLDRERVEAIFELSLEVGHLRAHGNYFRSELEIGILISRVTDGWVEAGRN